MGIETAIAAVSAAAALAGATTGIVSAARKPKMPQQPKMLQPLEADPDKDKPKLGAMPGVMTSPLGDQSTASVGRSKLLGN